MPTKIWKTPNNNNENEQEHCQQHHLLFCPFRAYRKPQIGDSTTSAPRALPNCDAAAAAPKTVAQLGAARKKVPISDNLFVI